MRDHQLDVMECRTGARLLLGLRVTVLLVAVVIVFGLSLYNMVRYWGTYEPPVAQACSFVLLAAILVSETVLIVQGRPWGKLQGLAVAVVIVASMVSYAALPEGSTATYADWIFGAANCVGLIVLLDHSLWVMIVWQISTPES
ncbi:MAG: hypothetical protein ACT4NY_26015 [Pseudonocardiales bacterium]